MSNRNAPAFPILLHEGEALPGGVEPNGLTKREEFAKSAMQGLLASGLHQVDDCLCHEAWSAADLMLAYQEKAHD